MLPPPPPQVGSGHARLKCILVRLKCILASCISPVLLLLSGACMILTAMDHAIVTTMNLPLTNARPPWKRMHEGVGRLWSGWCTVWHNHTFTNELYMQCDSACLHCFIWNDLWMITPSLVTFSWKGQVREADYFHRFLIMQTEPGWRLASSTWEKSAVSRNSV